MLRMSLIKNLIHWNFTMNFTTPIEFRALSYLTRLKFHPTNTCSNSKIETLEKGLKYV